MEDTIQYQREEEEEEEEEEEKMADQADTYPELKVEALNLSTPDHPSVPQGGGGEGSLGGKVLTSSQGKGVGIFAIGCSPGENGMEMADPKVCIYM